MIRIGVVEDETIFREELVYLLDQQQDMKVVAELDSVEAYLSHCDAPDTPDPDVLLLDIGLPGMSGIEGLPEIRKRQPETDVIMLSSFRDQHHILKALCSGAVGYLSKRAEDDVVLVGIRSVHSGGSYMSPDIAREIVTHIVDRESVSRPGLLTARQQEIIRGLADGLTYEQIGEQLFVSTETVRTHVKKMYRSLEVNNKAEAIAMYLRGEIG